MSKLLNIGICCMLISGWGVIQLGIMGCFFYMEVPTLLEECEPHEYEDYDDFIKKTKENYNKVAINCWIAAGVYVLSLIISIGCIKKANSNAKRHAHLLEDDEYVCDPRHPARVKEKKEKKNT